jgi:hypothetical protein
LSDWNCITVINTKDVKAAIKGMRGQMFEEHKKASKDGRKLEPLGIEPLTDARYLEVMDRLMEKHKPIENFFFKEMGNYLQYLDSQIAEAIMLTFANSGHPCLPVHDSFIVDFRGVFELKRLMDNFFDQALRQKIPVKDNMDQLFYGEVDKVFESLKEYPKDKERVNTLTKDMKEWVTKTKELFIKIKGEDWLNKSKKDWYKKHGLDM